ncbi:acetyl-CoA carboxylase [Rhizobium skierniewicense]|uniref:acetyl-CoA carboxylase n=1 Tax=Rhizobium skierniewicense TaxID=984260 RepID=UPI001FADF887|nr:acetyl-CoA carboxylase [Rhizobium skierniewicense]MCI9868687.1 acetyl-CoA carboxylase [Rhizobium skierniewicense]
MSTLDLSDPVTIAALTDALTTAGVDGLEITGRDGHLRIVIATNKSVNLDRVPVQNGHSAVLVKAPMAGIFCPSSTSSDEPMPIPRKVSAMDVIGFLRIGPVLLPVAAGRLGLLRKQLAETDALVGFGDSLFEIEPAL